MRMLRRPKRTKRPPGCTSKSTQFVPVMFLGESIRHTQVSGFVLDTGHTLDIVYRPGGEVRIGAKSLRRALGLPTHQFAVVWATADRTIRSPSDLGVDRPSNPIHDRATLGLPKVLAVGSLVRSGSLPGLSPATLFGCQSAAKALLEQWIDISALQTNSRRISLSAAKFGLDAEDPPDPLDIC